MPLRFADADRLTHLVRATDESPELELDIKASAGAEDGFLGLCGGVCEDLAPGSADRGAGDDDRGGSAVVADGQMRVVGL